MTRDRMTTTIRICAVLAWAGLAILLTACPAADDNTPPDLQALEVQEVVRGGVVEVGVEATDDTPDALTFTSVSSDAAVVSDADMTFVGSGSTRTLYIATDPLVTGTTTITVAVTDEEGLGDDEAFQLIVRMPFQTKPSKLVADDGAPHDGFGLSVAIEGPYALVGASFDSHEDAHTLEGSVYVHEREGSSWRQVQKSTAGDAEPGAMFGQSVAISGDYAVVGAPGAVSEGAHAGAG